MAEEGSKSEGAETQESAEPTGEAWTQKLNEIEQEIAADQREQQAIQAYAQQSQRSVPTSWLNATARDERAERVQKPQTRHTAQTHRSSSRYRGRHSPKPWTEAQWTAFDVRNAQRKLAPSDTPYSKGWIDTWWDKAVTHIFRWLGLE